MQDRTLPRWAGVVLLLAVAITFAANHIAARIAFDHGASVVTAVAARSSVTALALLALLAALRAPLRLPAPTLGRGCAIGAILAVQSYCLYSSVARIPVALALLAFNTYPMLFTLLSWAVGGDRPAPRALSAMPVALVGLTLALDVAGGTGPLALRFAEIGTGVGYSLVASACFVLVLHLSGRWLKDAEGRLRSVLINGTVAVLAWVGGALTTSLAAPVDGAGWLGLALLTLFYGSAITGLFVLQPHLRAASDVTTLNFEPIALLFLGWAILDQKLSPLQIAGALIVIGAIVALGTAKR